jgi:hypothetical protein
MLGRLVKGPLLLQRELPSCNAGVDGVSPRQRPSNEGDSDVADSVAREGYVLVLSIKTFIGLALFFTGLALPVIAGVGGNLYNAHVASFGGPVDYGAMILTYRALQISVVVGASLASGGLVMSIMSLGQATPRATPHA